MAFTKATKKKAKLRIAFEAPSGFGKTYTALLVATQLLEGTGKRIAFLDTEGRGQGSAAKYAHRFDFDVDEIKAPFDPARIIDSINDAVAGDYGAWICDSWSHFWTGEGGMLEIVDRIARTKYRGDSHRAWGDDAVGGLEQRVLDALLGAPLHVIVCARMKTDTVRETVREGDRERTRIRKAGLKAVQREGFDYEFDLVGKFEQPMLMTVDKTRLEDMLPPDTIIEKPAYLGEKATAAGKAFVPTLKAWLEDGADNTAIERPDTKDKQRLAKAVDALTVLDGSRDWSATAEAYAHREFGHPLAALTKPDFLATAGAMEAFAEKLVEQINADAAALANEPVAEPVTA